MITPTKEFWDVFKTTNGALSCAEALAIINIASGVKSGQFLEMGTHKGKSAISAMVSLPSGEFILLEPEFESLGLDFIKEIHKIRTQQIFIKPLLYYSTAYLSEVNTTDMFSYIFVDSGSHGDGLPMQEAKLLEDRLVQGGVVAFHDYKNQFVEVEQAYNYLVSTCKYEPIEINWQEIFDYVAENNLEEGNNSWHQYPDLPHPPNFVGALRKK